MNNADRVNAVIPHLIAALPQPFQPNEASAQQVLEAASQWALLLEAAERKGEKIKAHAFAAKAGNMPY